MKSIDCEICKFRYPFTVDSQGTTFDLFGLKNEPYVIFETITKECQSGLHIVSFADKETVTFGRGTDSDVKIPDISVSRVHARFHYRNGQFFVEDNNSKFGSLIRAKEPIKIEPNSTLHLQAGRTVLSYSVYQRQNYLNF